MLVFVAHVATLVVTAVASADVDTAALAAVVVAALSDVAAAAAAAVALTALAAASALTTFYCFFVFCDFLSMISCQEWKENTQPFPPPQSSTPPSILECAFLVFSYLLLPPVLISLVVAPDSYQDMP